MYMFCITVHSLHNYCNNHGIFKRLCKIKDAEFQGTKVGQPTVSEGVGHSSAYLYFKTDVHDVLPFTEETPKGMNHGRWLPGPVRVWLLRFWCAASRPANSPEGISWRFSWRIRGGHVSQRGVISRPWIQHCRAGGSYAARSYCRGL
jgi:hypothetical protein